MAGTISAIAGAKLILTNIASPTVRAVAEDLSQRDAKSAKSPVIVMDVKSIEESVKKIMSNGGKITREKTAVGDMGWYAQVQDTEGNVIGIWETIKK